MAKKIKQGYRYDVTYFDTVKKERHVEICCARTNCEALMIAINRNDFSDGQIDHILIKRGDKITW